MTQWHSHKAKSNIKPHPQVNHTIPILLSNRFAPLGEAYSEKPFESALFIRDSILWHVKLARPLGTLAVIVASYWKPRWQKLQGILGFMHVAFEW